MSEGGGFGGRGFWNAKRVMVEAVRMTHRPSQRVREIRRKSEKVASKGGAKELRKRHRRASVASRRTRPHIFLSEHPVKQEKRENREALARGRSQKRVLQNSVINVEQTFIINVKEKM